MRRLTVGWVVLRARAAALKLPASATVSSSSRSPHGVYTDVCIHRNLADFHVLTHALAFGRAHGRNLQDDPNRFDCCPGGAGLRPDDARCYTRFNWTAGRLADPGGHFGPARAHRDAKGGGGEL